MGAVCSCFQNDTVAVKARVIPMGQALSDHQVRWNGSCTCMRTHVRLMNVSCAQKWQSQPKPSAGKGTSTAGKAGIAGNPYGAQKLSVVARMNREEQNAGNFKVSARRHTATLSTHSLRRVCGRHLDCWLTWSGGL